MGDQIPALSLDERVLKQAVKSQLFGAEERTIRVGRFVVLRKLGEGGMGVVYSAYDEKLDRRVAIKMVRPVLTRDPRARERVLREARAMARVSHPNVVQVYEVGESGDQVFVAMEFIDGPTLREWLAQSDRSWREILRMFVAAGEGLVAAHREDLVHLDFKPDNVMIGKGDVPRVGDFGLARLGRAPEMAELVAESDAPTTHFGPSLAMGTPAYMAPEQARSEANARSDQYSFCVSLYEALYGVLPGDGEVGSRWDRARRRRPLPRWLTVAIERGMAVDPAMRWPNLEALLAHLHRGPMRRAVLAAVGTAVVGAGVAGVALSRPDAYQARCEAAVAQLDASWNADRRAAVGTAFAGTELPFAVDAWNRLEPKIDRYVSAWREAHRATCDAEQPHLMAWRAERLTCLERNGQTLTALVPRLERPGRHVVELAATADLLDPAAVDDCLRETPKTSGPQGDHEMADPALFSELLEAKIDTRLGDYEGARSHADAALELARSTQNGATESDALLWSGFIADRDGRYQDAQTFLDEAFGRATSVKSDDVAIDAAVELVYVVGERAHRYAEAHVRAGYARALIERVGGREDADARLDAHLGRVLTAQAKYGEAQTAYERAIAFHEDATVVDEGALAEILVDYAWTFIHRQQFKDAREVLLRAQTLTVRAVGTRHPRNVRIQSNLGMVTRLENNYAQAEEELLAALELGRAVLGPKHPDLAEILLTLGWARFRMRDLGLAQANFEEALEIRKAVLPDDHPEVAKVYGRLGVLARAEGQLERAEGLQRRVLAAEERAKGPNSPQLVPTLTNLANVLQDQAKLDEAEAVLVRARRIVEADYGATHPSLAPIYESLASIYDLGGKEQDARRVRRLEAELWETRVAELERQYGGFGEHLIKPLMKQASALGRNQEFEAAEPPSARLVELLAPLGDRLLATQMMALALRGNILEELGRADEAALLLDRVEELARIEGPSAEMREAWAALFRAHVSWSQGNRIEAHRLAREADALFRRGGGSRTPAQGWMDRNPL